MRIWMEENDSKHVFIDIGESNDVYNFMVRNSIFVEKTDGNVLTYSLEMFSLSLTARHLKALTNFYKENGWEVSEDVQEIVSDLVMRAEEERLRREDEKLRQWFEEQEKAKRQAQALAPYMRVRVRQKGRVFRTF